MIIKLEKTIEFYKKKKNKEEILFILEEIKKDLEKIFEKNFSQLEEVREKMFKYYGQIEVEDRIKYWILIEICRDLQQGIKETKEK